MAQYRFENGLLVDVDGADLTGKYDANGYAVYLSDDTGEIMSWTGTEWIEDPTVVVSILNATLYGIKYGPAALRATLGV